MKDHEITIKITEFNKLISSNETSSLLNLKGYSFLKNAMKYIESILKISIPELIDKADLDNIADNIDMAKTYLVSYFEGSNIANLNFAVDKIRDAIALTKNLPIPIKSADFDFTTNIDLFQKSFQDKTKAINNDYRKLSESIKDIEDEFKARKEELESLDNQIQEKKKELYEINMEFEAKYSEDKEDFRTSIEDERQKIIKTTEELVLFLHKKKEEASKIVNVVGNIGATGNFQKIANDHKKTANIWRIVAILFMALLSGMIIWSVLSLTSQDFDWTKSVLRIIAAAALSYPATYASRESSKHRKLANYNRKIELELSSIDAFIELMPDEKKTEIKEKLAEKYFGNTLNSFDDTDLKSDKDFSLQSIERIFKAVEPLLKK